MTLAERSHAYQLLFGIIEHRSVLSNSPYRYFRPCQVKTSLGVSCLSSVINAYLFVTIREERFGILTGDGLKMFPELLQSLWWNTMYLQEIKMSWPRTPQLPRLSKDRSQNSLESFPESHPVPNRTSYGRPSTESRRQNASSAPILPAPTTNLLL
jgi:hypothetical protein